MSYDHLIHEMLDHAVDSVDNMRACVIFMASLTGKNLGGPRALCVHAKRQNENKKNCNFNFIYLFGISRDEVAWDIDTIYLSHDTRILNLRDFDHLEPKWVRHQKELQISISNV